MLFQRDTNRPASFAVSAVSAPGAAARPCFSFTVATSLSISFERIDRDALLRRQRRLRLEMREQHNQCIANSADLLAVGAGIRQHLLFDIGIALLAEIDIDHA